MINPASTNQHAMTSVGFGTDSAHLISNEQFEGIPMSGIAMSLESAYTPTVHAAPMLDLQLLKCRTLRACCAGNAECTDTAIYSIAAQQLKRYSGAVELVTARGLEPLASAIASTEVCAPPIMRGNATKWRHDMPSKRPPVAKWNYCNSP